MILNYDYGISPCDIPNPSKWSKLARSLYYICVVIFAMMMLLSRECIGSLELTSRGPRYSFHKTDYTNFSRKHSNQCLVLSRNVTTEICSDKGKSQRIQKLRSNDLALNFCNMYTPLIRVIPPSDRKVIEKENTAECRNKLNKLVERDKEVSSMYCIFMEIIRKTDCDRTNFSVKWNCNDCKEAYKKWLCSYEMEYYHSLKTDQPFPPCNTFCSEVERKCPFIRPESNRTYAGEPSFICKDHSIFESQRLSSNSSNNCYEQQCNGSDCRFRVAVSKAILTNTNSNSTVESSCCINNIPLYSVWTFLTYFIYSWVVRTCSQYLTIGWT